ncbi:MAG: YMGG-like glycine zipper-containing protein [Vampirovibrionales bacterium]
MNTLTATFTTQPFHVKALIIGLATLQLLGTAAWFSPTSHAADICSTAYNRVLKDGAVGGLAGGAVGALVKSENRSKGALQGAVIGAAGGAGYGYYKEYRRKKDLNCDARASATYAPSTTSPYFAPTTNSDNLLGKLF